MRKYKMKYPLYFDGKVELWQRNLNVKDIVETNAILVRGWK